MRRIIIFFLAAFTIPASASEVDCRSLASKLDGPDGNYRPPLEAKVIGKGRLPFHLAPDPRCKMKGVFVISGDSLTVYKPYRNWLNVMYVSKENGDVSGWVESDRVEIIGQYGNNQ